MSRISSVALVSLTALTASAATLALQHVVAPPHINAQTPGPLESLSVYANSYGVSSQKFDAFIFVNQRTGDIWVYRDDDPRHHYRVTAMGQRLEEVKEK